jgi:DeoR/GlpR family transcriptional regulator of sugar metabolism
MARQAKLVARREAIARLVLAEGTVKIEALTERLGVSTMTVHRDLDELESKGILRKERGAASAVSSSVLDASDAYRNTRQLLEKKAIARACVGFLEPGQSIFLDDSTTVRQVAKYVQGRLPLTVICNALPLMNELSAIRGISLVGLGGAYFSWCGAFMGPSTTDEISRIRADTAILSTAAIVDDVCFHQQQDTVAVKKAMLAASAMKILLVDHTKFDKRALHEIVPLTDFDMVIVDSRTSEEHVSRLRSRGVNVVVAEPEFADESLHHARLVDSSGA